MYRMMGTATRMVTVPNLLMDNRGSSWRIDAGMFHPNVIRVSSTICAKSLGYSRKSCLIHFQLQNAPFKFKLCSWKSHRTKTYSTRNATQRSSKRANTHGARFADIAQCTMLRKLGCVLLMSKNIQIDDP